MFDGTHGLLGYLRRLTGICLCILLTTAATSFAQDTIKKTILERSPNDKIPAHNGLREGSSRIKEENLNRIIRAASAFDEKEGIPSAHEDKQWIEINIWTVAPRVLQRNLAILRTKLKERNAKAGIQETEAQYDPTVKLSVALEELDVSEREESVYNWQQISHPFKTDPDPVYITFADPSVIEYLKFNKERKEGFRIGSVIASQSPPWKDTDTTTYRASLLQKIPWGLEWDLTLNTVDSESYWINDNQSWGSYRRPWRSAFIQSLSIPLPLCKDFGPYDSVGTQIKEARLVDGLAYWEIQEVINNALLEAEITFWNLVAAVKAMQAAFKHKENITFLLKRTQALYNERMATEYDLAQVKRELAASNEQIDRAGNNIAFASNRLNELMDAEKSDVFLPIDYTTLLTPDAYPLPDAKTIIRNPALMKQIAKLKTAQLLKRHQQVQVRPDIKFLLTLILSQRHSGFGFDTAGESISKLFTSPDSSGQNYSLVYQYPLFNRAARSALEQAELDEERQQILIDQVRKRVFREINDAVVGLTSSQARIRIARKSLELAQLAYTKAMELQETREVTEYEVVIKSVDLHHADLDFIIAQIQRKVAETRLLGALGKLADRYSNK